MIPVNEPLLAGRESDYVMDCIQTGWISSAGRYIDRFETEWAGGATSASARRNDSGTRTADGTTA